MLNRIKRYKLIVHLNINKDKIIYIVISLFALILFFLLKNSPFNSDDWSLLDSALTNPFPYKSSWTDGGDLYYRPLVILLFYLNYLIAGGVPITYYSVNILMHLFNTILIIQLFKKIYQMSDCNLGNSNLYFLGSIFFLLPQNLYNVFWISGRTDLVCFLFLSISLYISVNIISKEKISFKHYISFSVFLILSFMSKETAILIIFYLSAIYILLDVKKRKTSNKFIILFIISVFIFLSFIIIRLVLWGKLSSSEIYLKLISYYTYMSIYGLASFILPFDIVEYYSSYFNNIFLFSLISILLIIILSVIIILSFSMTKNYIFKIIFTSIILFLSMSIYFIKYPLSRLAYSHVFLILLILILFFNYKYKFNTKLIKYLKIGIFALTFIGLSILINQKLRIDEYNNNVISVLNYNSHKKDIVSLATIIRIGQNWCLPPFNAIENLDNNNLYKNNTVSAFGIHMTTEDNIFNTVKYFRYGYTAIIVNSISNTILLSPVREPFYFFSEESVEINDEIEIKINKMSNSRPKYASSIIISFSPKIIKKSDVIYFGNQELCKGPFDLFINNLKYYSENNNLKKILLLKIL